MNYHPHQIPRHVTHPSLHAHVLFEAVRLGHLPMIRRRLTGTERAQLQSGDVFVWEEASHKGGLERWTDGRKWSASRMREPFLFYEEKLSRGMKGQDEYDNPHAYATSPQGLTKQTYSAWVTLSTDPNGNPYRKKWHMTAYFSASTFSSLPSVQDDPLLRQIHVPHNMYETGKGLLRKAPNSAKARAEAASNDPMMMFHDDRSQDGDEVDDDYMHGASYHPYHIPHHPYLPSSSSPPAHHSRPNNSLLSLPSPVALGGGTLPSPSFMVSPPMSSPGTSPHISRETQDYFPFGAGRSDAGTLIRDQRPYPTPTSDVFPGNVSPSAQTRSAADQKAVGSFRVTL
ncbi:Gti1/Pac2 family-domain-containing protein [Cantharellus anzutake]|uniref:Gti1/Pac2 family-domain-containing protein n=1 Tax=Cantharellus anzutake TaxID=1750568 RepID=UPI001906A041|nr:Gti1/Pac2 family-domain-containing protein [Cantharellus anzutake]KAF8313292.1 Gti1/Pac2 family-domain-containing protein [Cantharellus anzutake]